MLVEAPVDVDVAVRMTDVDTAVDHGVGATRRKGRAGKRGGGNEAEDDLAGHGSLLGVIVVSMAIGRAIREKVHGPRRCRFDNPVARFIVCVKYLAPAEAVCRMKPAPFIRHVPRTLHEALKILGEVASQDGRVLAGGQSLVPIMAFRLAKPAHLVDINEVAESVSERWKFLSICACVRHAVLINLSSIIRSADF